MQSRANCLPTTPSYATSPNTRKLRPVTELLLLTGNNTATQDPSPGAPLGATLGKPITGKKAVCDLSSLSICRGCVFTSRRRQGSCSMPGGWQASRTQRGSRSCGSDRCRTYARGLGRPKEGTLTSLEGRWLCRDLYETFLSTPFHLIFCTFPRGRGSYPTQLRKFTITRKTI